MSAPVPMFCPFCGCMQVDPRGWTGPNNTAGPACTNCDATTETLADWNRRVAHSHVALLRYALSGLIANVEAGGSTLNALRDAREAIYLTGPDAPTSMSSDAALQALTLHVAYEKLPTDRGGAGGPKGKAWQAFIDARDAALAQAIHRPTAGRWIVDNAEEFERFRQNFTTTLLIDGPNMTLPEMSERLCWMRDEIKRLSTAPEAQEPSAEMQVGVQVARDLLSDIVAGRGMFGIDPEDDLKWAIDMADQALRALNVGMQTNG